MCSWRRRRRAERMRFSRKGPRPWTPLDGSLRCGWRRILTAWSSWRCALGFPIAGLAERSGRRVDGDEIVLNVATRRAAQVCGFGIACYEVVSVEDGMAQCEHCGV